VNEDISKSNRYNDRYKARTFHHDINSICTTGTQTSSIKTLPIEVGSGVAYRCHPFPNSTACRRRLFGFHHTKIWGMKRLALRHMLKKQFADIKQATRYATADMQWKPQGMWHSPNTANVLAHLVGISALQLTKFCVAFDLEEHLVPSRCHYLLTIGSISTIDWMISIFTPPFLGCETIFVKTHFDVDRAVGIFRFDFVVASRGRWWCAVVRHYFMRLGRVCLTYEWGVRRQHWLVSSKERGSHRRIPTNAL
jgi:hypothetical protein